MPLVRDSEVIGLLFVADRYHRMHTAQSISILCTLATHGAVALRNARDFERANAALEKADQARSELERHLRSIQAATDAHEQMTSLLARGASLATLCQSVAQLLGGNVLVLDEAGEAQSGGSCRTRWSPTSTARSCSCAAPTAALDVRQAVSAWARGELRPMHRGVLSRPVAGPAEISALYPTLRRALAVLGRLGIQGQIVGQNELALYSTLFETHDRASLENFLEATLGPLIGDDRKRNPELAPTLLCYFDQNQNAKTTAQRLGIHVNTVRPRLATIEGLLGHWGNASRALEIHIAPRLWHLAGATAER